MATVREQLTEARDLIQQERHEEARSLLVNINHPKATEWLEQLDSRYPAVKKRADRKKAATYQPPADPFANAAEAPERSNGRAKAAATADTGNAGITAVTVLLGGFIAVAVTMGLMLFVDNVMKIHPYFMDDPRRIFTTTMAFVAVSTAAMGLIARLFGNTHNLLIGFYYVLLNFILLIGWHYTSYHMHWGDGIASLLSPDGVSAYSSFLSAVPGDLMMAYGLSSLISTTIAFPFGAATNEELRRRFLERNK